MYLTTETAAAGFKNAVDTAYKAVMKPKGRNNPYSSESNGGESSSMCKRIQKILMNLQRL